MCFTYLLMNLNYKIENVYNGQKEIPIVKNLGGVNQSCIHNLTLSVINKILKETTATTPYIYHMIYHMVHDHLLHVPVSANHCHPCLHHHQVLHLAPF